MLKEHQKNDGDQVLDHRISGRQVEGEKTVVLATSSPGKVQEYREHLKGFSGKLLFLKDFAAIEDPEETEDTFKGNALLKARYYAKETHHAALADDSGLSIEALNGFPGVYSKRYAESFPSYPEAFFDLMGRLEGKDKSAHMVCAIAYVDLESGIEIVVEARAPGKLVFDPQKIAGFGVDPIFLPEGGTKTYAEDLVWKKAHSHRRQALDKMLDKLREMNILSC